MTANMLTRCQCLGQCITPV